MKEIQIPLSPQGKTDSEMNRFFFILFLLKFEKQNLANNILCKQNHF